MIEFLDSPEDEPVVFAIEVRLGYDVRDLVKSARGKQQAPEYRLFTFY